MTKASEKAHDKADVEEKKDEIGLKEDAHGKKEEPTAEPEHKLKKKEQEVAVKATALKGASDSLLHTVLHKRAEAIIDTCTDEEITAELKRRGR